MRRKLRPVICRKMLFINNEQKGRVSDFTLFVQHRYRVAVGMGYQQQDYQKAADFIRERTGLTPQIAIILGSGLGKLADLAEDAVRIPYEDIPLFSRSTVDSHKGELIVGKLVGKTALIMAGRFHYYEGYSMEQITFPIRVFSLLGIQNLIVTNAAGGINTGFAPGDFMLIEDHIKFFSESPARGENIPAFGQRFFDLSEAYSAELRGIAEQAAEACGIALRHGVYAYMPGPQFETPAEIRMLRTLGADAVGMSTVPEVITANQCGIRVLGISCISNMAAGILQQPITDDEVVEVANRVSKAFVELIVNIVKQI